MADFSLGLVLSAKSLYTSNGLLILVMQHFVMVYHGAFRRICIPRKCRVTSEIFPWYWPPEKCCMTMLYNAIERGLVNRVANTINISRIYPEYNGFAVNKSCILIGCMYFLWHGRKGHIPVGICRTIVDKPHGRLN